MQTHKKQRPRLFQLSACLLIVGSFMIMGCATKGMTDDKARAVRSLDDLNDRIAEATKQVEEMTAAVEGLTKATDLLAAYKTFTTELSQTRDMERAAAKRRADMDVNASAYIGDWRAQSTGLQNTELREAAAKRIEAIEKSFQAVREKAKAAREAYDPYITNLDDLEAYLLSDLTPGGVRAAESVIKKVSATGAQLKAAIEAYNEELNKAAKQLEMGPTAEPKPEE